MAQMPKSMLGSISDPLNIMNRTGNIGAAFIGERQAIEYLKHAHDWYNGIVPGIQSRSDSKLRGDLDNIHGEMRTWDTTYRGVKTLPQMREAIDIVKDLEFKIVKELDRRAYEAANKQNVPTATFEKKPVVTNMQVYMEAAAAPAPQTVRPAMMYDQEMNPAMQSQQAQQPAQQVTTEVPTVMPSQPTAGPSTPDVINTPVPEVVEEKSKAPVYIGLAAAALATYMVLKA